MEELIKKIEWQRIEIEDLKRRISALEFKDDEVKKSIIDWAKTWDVG